MKVLLNKYKISIEYLSSGFISNNKGNTIRGGFGTHLKRLCCSDFSKECSTCDNAEHCAYCYLFETVISVYSRIMKKYTNAPHPYIFEHCLNTSGVVKKGDFEDFSITLIGNANEYFVNIFIALKELGAKGFGKDKVKFDIKSIVSDDGCIIYNQQSTIFGSVPACKTIDLTRQLKSENSFTLKFITPLRYKKEGKISSNFVFADFFKTLLRRIKLVLFFHCGTEIDCFPDEIYETAESIEIIDNNTCWKNQMRFSTRQKQRIPLDGLIGSIKCRGNIGALLPYLKAGEYLHVGKNASFGLGRYELSIEGDF